MLVAADDGLTLCGGTLTHMDAFVAQLSDRFGLVAPTGGEKILFQWVSSDAYAAATSCPDASFGCFEGDRIVSMWAPLNHELVHSLAFAYGRPPTFFEEGLAESFQGIGVVYSDFPIEYDIWSTIDAQSGTFVDRTAAAAFVTTLIARYGVKVFLDLYSALSANSTREEIDQGFRSVLGTSLAESVAEFEAANPPFIDIQDFDAKLMECSAPELTWDGFHLTEFRALDCTQEDAIGPYNGEVLQVLHTITVEKRGDFEINVIAERPEGAIGARNAFSLLPCGASGAETRVYAGERTRLSLSPGRYSLRLLGSSTTVTEIGFTLTRIDSIGP